MSGVRTGLLTTNAGGEVVLRRVLVRVVAGPSRGREAMLDGGTLVVGSHPDADLQIEEPTVSRYHAELGLLADGVRVRDLDSRNGTFVGDNRVEAVVVRPACEVRVGRARIELVPADIPAPDAAPDITHFGRMVGESPAMRRVFGLLSGAALSTVPVLLEGEGGVGKSAAARALHEASRPSGPLVVFDCVAPQGELEDAARSAARGTLVFDRLDGMSARLAEAVRARLDRGDLDARVVGTSSTDLRERIRAGALHRDLYFHFAGVRVEVPPLRERREDLPRLIAACLDRLGFPEMRLGAAELATLRGRPFPGNVRELVRVVEASALKVAGPARPSVEPGRPSAPPPPPPADTRPFKEAKEELVGSFERSYVTALLERHDGNVSRAASEAGLDRNYLARLAKKHGVR